MPNGGQLPRSLGVKQIKQEPGLAGDVEVQSYAAIVVHTSIVYLRYMMLAYYHGQIMVYLPRAAGIGIGKGGQVHLMSNTHMITA